MEANDFSGLMTGSNLPRPEGISIPKENEEFLGPFLQSTTSALEALEAAALEYETESEGEEAANSVRHILHSIKGEAGILGLAEINELCHETESAFEALDALKGADMVLRAKDWIGCALRCLEGAPEPVAEAIADEPEAAKPESEPEFEPEPKPDVSATDAAGDATSPFRCLIVEDEFTSRKLIKAFLSPYAECNIAADGAEAVEAVRVALQDAHPYDLICLDIMMPRMNGQEALAAIRKLEEEHNIAGLDAVKVIMTTALGNSENVLGAFRTGCEAYVVKPIDKQRLLNEVRKLGLIR